MSFLILLILMNFRLCTQVHACDDNRKESTGFMNPSDEHALERKHRFLSFKDDPSSETFCVPPDMVRAAMVCLDYAMLDPTYGALGGHLKRWFSRIIRPSVRK
jgi:hypothetical protein